MVIKIIQCLLLKYFDCATYTVKYINYETVNKQINKKGYKIII